MNLDKLISSIKEGEGLRLNPYTDTTGHQTIGYGHLMANGISLAAAEQILRDDVAIAVQRAKSEKWWPMIENDDVRARAAVEIVFNLGSLRGFPKASTALASGDFQTASAELLDSLWYKQVGQRAERLASMISTGKDHAG